MNPSGVSEVESAELNLYLDTPRHTELLAVDLEGRTNTSYNNTADLRNKLAPDIVDSIGTEGLKTSTEDTKCVNTEGFIGDVRSVTRGGEQLEGYSEGPPRGPVEGHQGVEEAGTGAAQKPSSVWVEGLVPGIDFCNHGERTLTTFLVIHLVSPTYVDAFLRLDVVNVVDLFGRLLQLSIACNSSYTAWYNCGIPYRWQGCCIMGNWWSWRFQHWCAQLYVSGNRWHLPLWLLFPVFLSSQTSDRGVMMYLSLLCLLSVEVFECEDQSIGNWQSRKVNKLQKSSDLSPIVHFARLTSLSV